MHRQVKMLRYFLSILFYCGFLWATDTEEIYILPMGQGNGQFIIYKRESGDVGVLYDLGSKSLQMHPKFGSRGDWQQPFLAQKQKEIRTNRISIPLTPEYNRVRPVIFTPDTSDEKRAVLRKDPIKNELKELVSASLLKGLRHLFIFLSHSDEDHINYVNRENIPRDVPITVILSGDWFGDIGAQEGKTNLTEPAKKVFEFLAQRIKNQSVATNIFFPYYSMRLNELIQGMLGRSSNVEDLSIFSREITQHCLKMNPHAPNPPFLQGYFLDVFKRSFQIDLDARAVLENIYIWSLNQPADSTNNHSMVISCTLPNLNMSVVLTGDAEHSVFQRIAVENNEQGFHRVLGEHLSSPLPIVRDHFHLIMLMLPHHGALANRSGSMLSFFKPNVFGISAGDGRQYGHPSSELIQQIREIYTTHPFSTLCENFYNRYTYRDKFHFIALEETSSGKEKHHVIERAEEDKLLFLCPNIYGCIKWDKHGIRTNFDNIVEFNEEQKYFVLYAAHAFELDKLILDTIEAGTPTGTFMVEETGSEEALYRLDNPLEYYDYLVQCPTTGDLFVGVNIVEKSATTASKVYFYKLLPVFGETSSSSAAFNK